MNPSLAECQGSHLWSRSGEGSSFQPHKAHRYLVSLVRTGLASQSPKAGRYDFGAALRRLGAESLSDQRSRRGIGLRNDAS